MFKQPLVQKQIQLQQSNRYEVTVQFYVNHQWGYVFDTFGSITPNTFNGNIIFSLEVEDFYSNSGSFFDVLGTNLQQNVAIYRLDQPDSSNTIGFKRYVFNYASQDAYTRYRTSTHIFTSADYDKTIPLIIQYE